MRAWTAEELAIMASNVAESPPLSHAQLSQISGMIGLVPVDLDSGSDRHALLGSANSA